MISALWDSLGRKLLPPYIHFIKRLNILIDEMLHPDAPFYPFFSLPTRDLWGWGSCSISLDHPRELYAGKTQAAVKVTLLVI